MKNLTAREIKDGMTVADMQRLLEGLSYKVEDRKTRCPNPNHVDRDPSATVNRFNVYCHVCDEAFDVFTIYARALGLSLPQAFPQVLQEVAEDLGLAGTGPQAAQNRRRVLAVAKEQRALDRLKGNWHGCSTEEHLRRAKLAHYLYETRLSKGCIEYLAGRGLKVAPAYTYGVRSIASLAGYDGDLPDGLSVWRGKDGLLIPCAPLRKGDPWTWRVRPLPQYARLAKEEGLGGHKVSLIAPYGGIRGGRPLVVAEGGPDTLTLAELCGDAADVIGLAGGVVPAHAHHVFDGAAVLLAMHVDEAKDGGLNSNALQKAAVAIGRARPSVVRVLPALGSRDYNDAYQEGDALDAFHYYLEEVWKEHERGLV